MNLQREQPPIHPHLNCPTLQRTSVYQDERRTLRKLWHQNHPASNLRLRFRFTTPAVVPASLPRAARSLVGTRVHSWSRGGNQCRRKRRLVADNIYVWCRGQDERILRGIWMAPQGVWGSRRHVPPFQGARGDREAVVRLEVFVHIVQRLSGRRKYPRMRTINTGVKYYIAFASEPSTHV
jgi:hypothetical protein